MFSLQEQLEDEQEELARGIGKLERQATNISDQIKTDAQVYLKYMKSSARYILDCSHASYYVYRSCYVCLVYRT